MNPADPTDAPQDSALSRALDGLWQRFLPEIIARITTLESAATAIADGGFAPEQREAAHADAHKLAGVLGTFGLARGTELARELELALSSESPLATETAARFTAVAAELRALVENRK